MQEEEDKLKALYHRYLRLAIISLFLMALLQGLNSMFLTIFFWLAVGFGILALNYHIAAKRAAQPNASWQNQEPAGSSLQNKKNIFIAVISISVVLIVFVSVLVSIFSSSSNDDEQKQNEQKQEQSTENSSQQNESDQPTAYQLAAKEYDNQNYRQSISMCRKTLLQQSDNLETILLLGDNYGALKQYDSAYIWFNKAYQLGSRSAYLSHWMGYFYDEKGETSRAIEFYKDAIRQDSTRTQVYDRLAEIDPDRADWYKAKSAQWKSK